MNELTMNNMNMGPDAAMIVSMQMSINVGWMDEYNFLFEKWMIMNGGTFFGILCFTIFIAFISESAGFILKTKSSILNPVVFMLLRLVNYSQMLIVMSYNLWVILTLALA